MIDIGIREVWDDSEALQKKLLDIVDIQFKLASSIAEAERTFSEAFVSERESMYKGSDSMARQKAKQLVGTYQTEYEYDFQAYTNLIQVITFRISQLSLRVGEEHSKPHVPPSGATSETDVWLETR